MQQIAVPWENHISIVVSYQPDYHATLLQCLIDLLQDQGRTSKLKMHVSHSYTLICIDPLLRHLV